MAKRGGRSGRKYVRDSIGRFATTGATARGGRLKTKSGKKRATQTVKAKTGSKPAGAIKGKIKRDPGAAKPAVAKTKLKRSGEKIGVNSLKTNKEQGRKGIASMSSRAKAARKGDVAERKSRRMSRIAERQSEIVARRQGRRASNYNPDGTFNQSTANANQRRLGRSKQLQEKLSYAGGGKNIASKALSKRRKAKPAAAKRRGAVGKISEAKAGRIVAKGNIRRTGGRLGPKNTIKPGPKSPRTKMNRAIDNVIKKGKALKGSAEKLRGVKKQADALRGRMLKEDKGRLSRALSKPSVTDKRSRDYGGRLTKGARGQDPATGGKKSRAKRGDTAEANIPMKGRRGKQLDASISKAAKQVKAAETARLIKPKAQRKSERAAKAEAKRQTAAAKPKRVRSAESLRVSRAKRITKERSISLNPAGNTQKGAGRMAANAKRTQERALAFYKGKPKPAAAKRRGAVGKISEAKAGRIVARMDAQRGRKAMPGRRNENFSRTYERSRQFILKPAATARNKGKPISVNESVQKAVANAAKRRKPKRRRG